MHLNLTFLIVVYFIQDIDLKIQMLVEKVPKNIFRCEIFLILAMVWVSKNRLLMDIRRTVQNLPYFEYKNIYQILKQFYWIISSRIIPFIFEE